MWAGCQLFKIFDRFFDMMVEWNYERVGSDPGDAMLLDSRATDSGSLSPHSLRCVTSLQERHASQHFPHRSAPCDPARRCEPVGGISRHVNLDRRRLQQQLVAPSKLDLPPLNSTTSRERIWGWSKPREATNATRKEGIG